MKARREPTARERRKAEELHKLMTGFLTAMERGELRPVEKPKNGQKLYA